MNKKEFIEKLKMHGAWCTECHDIHGEKDRYVKFAKVRELLEQIDEPQVDKVEVPSMIAKFIKENSDPIFEICAWSDHYGSDGRTCDDPELSVVLDWYGSNTKEFYEAVLNGYTVKQEPKWVVKDSRSTAMYFNSVAGVSKDGEFGCGWSEITGCVKFTDKAKAAAVAVLVEGSVEEV